MELPEDQQVEAVTVCTCFCSNILINERTKPSFSSENLNFVTKKHKQIMTFSIVDNLLETKVMLSNKSKTKKDSNSKTIMMNWKYY